MDIKGTLNYYNAQQAQQQQAGALNSKGKIRKVKKLAPQNQLPVNPPQQQQPAQPVEKPRDCAADLRDCKTCNISDCVIS